MGLIGAKPSFLNDLLLLCSGIPIFFLHSAVPECRHSTFDNKRKRQHQMLFLHEFSVKLRWFRICKLVICIYEGYDLHRTFNRVEINTTDVCRNGLVFTCLWTKSMECFIILIFYEAWQMTPTTIDIWRSNRANCKGI